MKDKVVFITGANGGLGTSVTRAFLQKGARVIGGSLHIAAADFPEPNFEALALDFNKLDEIRRGVATIVERYGQLDVLVHLLGGFAGGPSVVDTTDAMWEQMQDINLTSAFRVFRECIPHLRKSGSGRLIAIGSLTAGNLTPISAPMWSLNRRWQCWCKPSRWRMPMLASRPTRFFPERWIRPRTASPFPMPIFQSG